MDNNNDLYGSANTNSVGTNNGGGVPPPPKPEIKMRTMESDIKSVEESGGGVPEPETVKPLNWGEETGPVFKPETTMPESANGPTLITGAPDEDLKKGGSWWIWLLVLLVVVVGGALVYFYAWPLIFPKTPVTPETPVVDNELLVPVTPPAPTTPATVHQSAFRFSDDKISIANVSSLSVLAILTALQNSAEQVPADKVKEVAVQLNSAPIEFSSYLATLLPEVAGSGLPDALTAAFEKDFTAYLYYQDGKAWPGYVVKKKAGVEVSPVTILAQLATIESSTLSNLYLTPPTGSPETFRTGAVGEKYSSRYAPFAEKPASLNYGLFGDYLIISTTYQGLAEAIKLLGI